MNIFLVSLQMLSQPVSPSVPMGQQLSLHGHGALTAGDSDSNPILVGGSSGTPRAMDRNNITQEFGPENPCVKDKIDNLIENYLLEADKQQDDPPPVEPKSKNNSSESVKEEQTGEELKPVTADTQACSSATDMNNSVDSKPKIEIKREHSNEDDKITKVKVEDNSDNKHIECDKSSVTIKNEDSKSSSSSERGITKQSDSKTNDNSKTKPSYMENDSTVVKESLEPNMNTTFQTLINQVLDDSLHSAAPSDKEEEKTHILELCDQTSPLPILTSSAPQEKSVGDKQTVSTANPSEQNDESAESIAQRSSSLEDMSISKRKQMSLKDHIERVLEKSYMLAKVECKDPDSKPKEISDVKKEPLCHESTTKETLPSRVPDTKTYSAQNIVDSVIDKGMSNTLASHPTPRKDKSKDISTTPQGNKISPIQADNIHNLIMRQIQVNFHSDECNPKTSINSSKSNTDKTNAVLQGMVHLQNHMMETVSNISKKMNESSSHSEHLAKRSNIYGSRQNYSDRTPHSEPSTGHLKDNVSRIQSNQLHPNAQHQYPVNAQYNYPGGMSQSPKNIRSNQLSPRQQHSPRQLSPHPYQSMATAKSPLCLKQQQHYGVPHCSNQISLRDCQCAACDSKLGRQIDHMLPQNRDREVRESHARDQHVREQQARELHSREQQAKELQAREYRDRELQARELQARELHAREQVREYGALKPGGISNGAPYQAVRPQAGSYPIPGTKLIHERGMAAPISSAMALGPTPPHAYYQQPSNPFKMPQLYPSNPPIPSPREYNRALADSTASGSPTGPAAIQWKDGEHRLIPQQPVPVKPVPYNAQYIERDESHRRMDASRSQHDETIPILDLSVKRSYEERLPSTSSSSEAPLDLSVKVSKSSSEQEPGYRLSQNTRYTNAVQGNLLQYLENSVDKHCVSPKPVSGYPQIDKHSPGYGRQGQAVTSHDQYPPKSGHPYGRGEEHRGMYNEVPQRGQHRLSDRPEFSAVEAHHKGSHRLPERHDYSIVVDHMGLVQQEQSQSQASAIKDLHQAASQQQRQFLQIQAQNPQQIPAPHSSPQSIQHSPHPPHHQGPYPTQVSPHIPQPRHATPSHGPSPVMGHPPYTKTSHLLPPSPQSHGHIREYPSSHASPHMQPQLHPPSHPVRSPQPPHLQVHPQAHVQSHQQHQPPPTPPHLQTHIQQQPSQQLRNISPKPMNHQSPSPSFSSQRQDDGSPVDIDGGKRANVSRHEPIQNIIGNHQPNDILYLICRICGQTYGSPYGFRKHFRNQHGFEPRADHTIVQTISATKNARQVPPTIGLPINVAPYAQMPQESGAVPRDPLPPPLLQMADLSQIQGTRELQDLHPQSHSLFRNPPSAVDQESGERSRSNSRSSRSSRGSDDREMQRQTPESASLKDSIKPESKHDPEKETDSSTSDKRCMECPECGQTFQLNDFGLYKRHCRQHGQKVSGPFQSADTPSVGSDQVSSSRDISAGDSICPHCGIPFANPTFLMDHITHVHPDKHKSEFGEPKKSDVKNEDVKCVVTKAPAESATISASPDSSCEPQQNKESDRQPADSSGDQEMPVLKKQVFLVDTMEKPAIKQDTITSDPLDVAKEKIDKLEIPEVNYLHKKFSSHRKRKPGVMDIDITSIKVKRLNSDGCARSPGSVNSPSTQSNASYSSDNSNIHDTVCMEVADSNTEGELNIDMGEDGDSDKRMFGKGVCINDSDGKPVARHNLPFVWDRVTRSQAGKNIKPPTYH